MSHGPDRTDTNLWPIVNNGETLLLAERYPAPGPLDRVRPAKPRIAGMDLSDLLIFKTVADEGGILRAAKRLHRVQSNVTTRIKQLEQSLGVQLFFRERQRLFLSPSGDLLLTYADRLLRLADEAKGAVTSGTPRGVLRLGALESTTASRLPAIFCELHKRFPEVRVELRTATNDGLVEAVADRRLDAAFVAETPTSPDLAHLPLFTERLILISS